MKESLSLSILKQKGNIIVGRILCYILSKLGANYSM